MYHTERMHSPYFTAIAQHLEGLPAAEDAICGGRKLAAVAIILRENGRGHEVLFIERARHPADPWSGDIGFPGGRRDGRDRDLRQTAERETLEEVGIDLGEAAYLGRLSDVVGANLPVRVACFVYGLISPVEMVFSPEVHDAFWFGLDELWEPHRQLVAAEVRFGERSLTAPAIRLHTRRPVLWGITYRLVGQFRQVWEDAQKRPGT